MRGTVELTPDMLAQLVCGVLESNGYKADGLALYAGDQLVGYERAVIHLEMPRGLEIYPPPKQETISRDELNRMLNPYVPPAAFAARNGAAAGS